MTPEETKARRDLERIEAEREKLFHGTPSAANDDHDPMEVLASELPASSARCWRQGCFSTCC